MDEEIYDSILKRLTTDYFLLKKWKIYGLIGGFIGIMTATGIFSYRAFENATNDTIIKERRKKAISDGDKITAIKKNAEPLLKQLDSIGRNQEAILPIGTIISFAGNIADIPNNWLLCDGKRISRREYATLFGRISILWGKGDEINTFNIPDLRDRFLRGASTIKGKERKIGSFQEDATKMPTNKFTNKDSGQHSHSFSFETNAGRQNGNQKNTVAVYPQNQINISTSGDGKHNHLIVGGDEETRPKNVAVYFIIKVK